ncbi:MAG: metallopeptidase TldD-related protein [Acidimicrobiia bacterium]|nr:metallopeptidase TldD-related protein [Acidimicrobiia bacterium]
MTAQTYFDELIIWAGSQLQGDEVLTASLTGEDSDFVRFNDGAVRQAGSVRQREITIDLIAGDTHCAAGVQLAQDADLDRARIGALIVELRDRLALVPPDPYLSYATDTASTERVTRGVLPEAKDAIGEIQAAGTDRDLVGIYASGDTFTGFANSLGQRNWHQSATFNFDWSFYLRADRAVKNLYAGRDWDDDAFAAKVAWSQTQLDALSHQAVDLKPGTYRTYLAPAALTELVDMMSWGGFGLKAHRTKQTPLLKMVTEGATLDTSVRIVEDTAGGVAPNFQQQGFLRPDEVVLIDSGRYHDHLVSPRSAREYGVATNGASPWESPESVAMAAGTLPTTEVLSRLDTGLYVGNLWYLNFSDRAACRTTGMTRFATFWVEGGEIVAPANVLRFDDTAYHLLGDNLVGLTDEVETMLDPATYGGRSSASHRLPGALVDDMAFTL